jgi:diguanylate cyclase (GGDEF)-like protein
MWKFMKRYAIPILVVIFFAIGAFSQSASAATSASAVNGTVDLSSWDASDALILDGEWRFYPFMLKDETVGSGELIAIPDDWRSYQEFGTPPSGYATYTLSISGLNPGVSYAVFIKEEGCAYNLYINDHLTLSNGTVGKTEAEYEPRWNAAIGYFSPNPEGTAFFEIEIASYGFYHGGFWNTIRLGSASVLTTEQKKVTIVEAFMFAVFGAIGFAFLTLSTLSRREYKAFYLGLFALLLSIRVLVTGNRLILDFFPNLPWILIVRADYLFGMLIFPVIGLLIYYLEYIKPIPSVKMRYFGFGGLVILLGILLPINAYVVFFDIFRYLIILASIFFFYQLIRGLLRKETSAIFMFLSGASMLAALISEFFYAGNQFMFISAAYAMTGLMTIMIIDDFIDAKRMKQVLESQVIIDELTGAFNRYHLKRIMSRGYVYRNPASKLYILFLDVNEFKAFNDLEGHLVGDQILIAFAFRIREVVETKGLVFRYGGDEFMVLYELSEPDSIEKIVERIDQRLREPIVAFGQVYSASASIGYSEFNPSTDIFENALSKSDRWMYYNKKKNE